MGNVHWTANCITGIVVAIKRARQTANVIDERVGIQIVVTVIDVAAAVKFIGSAFRDKGDLCAGVPAILGLVLTGQNLEFGHGVDADGHILAVIGACIDISYSVDGQLIACTAVTVYEYVGET